MQHVYKCVITMKHCYYFYHAFYTFFVYKKLFYKKVSLIFTKKLRNP